MKKYFTLALLMVAAVAAYADFPLLKNNKKWCIEYERCFTWAKPYTYTMSPSTYYTMGDTVYNNLEYKIFNAPAIANEIIGLMREEGTTTYIHFISQNIWEDEGWEEQCEGCGMDMIFCKFDVNVGDSIDNVYFGDYARNAGNTYVVDSLKTNEEGRKYVYLHAADANNGEPRGGNLTWLEGVGSLSNRIWYMPPPGITGGVWDCCIGAQTFCVYDVLEGGTEELVYQTDAAKELGCNIYIETPIEEAEICAPYIGDAISNTRRADVRLINTAGGVLVRSGAAHTLETADVYMMDGTNVGHIRIVPNGNEGFIPLPLPNGCYLFRIHTATGNTLETVHIIGAY